MYQLNTLKVALLLCACLTDAARTESFIPASTDSAGIRPRWNQDKPNAYGIEQQIGTGYFVPVASEFHPEGRIDNSRPSNGWRSYDNAVPYEVVNLSDVDIQHKTWPDIPSKEFPRRRVFPRHSSSSLSLRMPSKHYYFRLCRACIRYIVRVIFS